MRTYEFVELLKREQLPVPPDYVAFRMATELSYLGVKFNEIEEKIRKDAVAAERFFYFSMCWIYVMAMHFAQKRCDPRNEMAGNACRIIMLQCNSNLVYLDAAWGENQFAEEALIMAKALEKEHRTSQQAITRLVFTYLDECRRDVPGTIETIIGYATDPIKEHAEEFFNSLNELMGTAVNGFRFDEHWAELPII